MAPEGRHLRAVAVEESREGLRAATTWPESRLGIAWRRDGSDWHAGAGSVYRSRNPSRS